jgi:D-tyrosyl-tRNA(Tyr) deacylase
MRALVQRVTRAAVRVDGQAVGAIGPGLLILLGVRQGDTLAEAQWLARKVASLRIFGGEGGKFERTLEDVGGSLLVVSQFTLYGDARRGRRPDFTAAAEPQTAEALYAVFVASLRAAGHAVETGTFGAMMEVESVNDGPVTLLVEREAAPPSG